MKRPSSLTRVLLMLLAGAAWPAPGFAQRPPTGQPASQQPAAEAFALEQVPGKLTELDAELNARLEAARAAVEAELAAQRISEPVAQSLRFSLRASDVASAAMARGLLNTARVPAESPALALALKEFEAANTLVQTRRAALLADTRKEVRRRASAIVRGATRAAEVSALIAVLEPLREVPRQSAELLNGWSTLMPTLNALKRVIDAQAAGTPAALGSALSTLRQTSASDREILTDGEVQERVDSVLLPFIQAAGAAQAALEEAIRARKPAAQLAPVLRAYEEAGDRLSRVRGSDSEADNAFRANLPVFRAMAAAQIAMEAGDEALIQARLQDFQNALLQTVGRRSAPLETLCADWQRQTAEESAKKLGERIAGLRVKLGAAQKPADLEAIIEELTGNGGGSTGRARNGGEAEGFQQLAAQLGVLARAWSWADPALFERVAQEPSERGAFSRELGELRQRVERSVLARALRVPELNAPPLAAQPFDEALEVFCTGLAAKSDWRRIYQILQARASIQAASGRRQDDGTLAALRSFFAGQNFELAEQWADAAQAYKLVLQNVSPLAPVPAAAERLKALRKEHPEAVTAPARPAFNPGQDQ